MKQNRILLPFLAICLVACSKDDDEGHSKNEQNVPVKEITFKNCSFTMVKVDGGTFQMGATREQEASGWKPDRTEYPVHKVTLNTFISEKQRSQRNFGAQLWKQSATILNTISLKAWSGTTFNLYRTSQPSNGIKIPVTDRCRMGICSTGRQPIPGTHLSGLRHFDPGGLVLQQCRNLYTQ